MKRIISKQKLLAGIIFLHSLYLFSTGICQSEDSLIAEVENGLLSYVLIEGESTYTLAERMAYYKVPGISITVINDYKIDFSKQYGLMDSELQKPVNEQTMFNVGSLSKGVAALAVLRLAQEGKIDLYRHINEQLISWKLPENEFTGKGMVTPFLLMNHSGGVMFSPSYAYLPDNFPTLLQVLNGESPAQSKPVVVDRIPGTAYQYSNAGYTILQQLTIDAGKKSYPELISEKIFEALEMHSSTFEQPLPEDIIIRASAGHLADGVPIPFKRYYYPHLAGGGLWTTTNDYAKFIIELQKSYLGSSNRIISKKLTKEMLSPHVSKQYGLGVFMREKCGEINYFGHMGDNRGFFAGFVSHLTDGCGAVVFTNSQNGAMLIREIFQGIAKIYNWKDYLPAAYKTVALTDSMIDRYRGRYKLGSDDVFEITKEGSELYINRFDQARLYHIGDGKFVIKSREGSLWFHQDSINRTPTVIYHFSDGLGRFLSPPQNCSRLAPGTKIPLELLHENNISEATELYRNLKKADPSDFYVSENRFNNLGYEFLRQEKYKQALAVFMLNVEFYPQSANCYDSLAEAFMKSGDREQAIIYYNRALALNPNNQNAVEKLKILEKEN